MQNRVIFFSVMLFVPTWLFSMNSTPKNGSSEQAVQLLKKMSTSVQNVVDIFLKYEILDPNYEELGADFVLATRYSEYLIENGSKCDYLLKKLSYSKEGYTRFNNAMLNSYSFLIALPESIRCDSDDEPCIMNSKDDFKKRETLIRNNVLKLQNLKNSIDKSIAEIDKPLHSTAEKIDKPLNSIAKIEKTPHSFSKIEKPLYVNDVPRLLEEFINECKRIRQLGIKARESGNDTEELKKSLNNIIEELAKLLSSIKSTQEYMKSDSSFATIHPRLEYAYSYLLRMNFVLRGLLEYKEVPKSLCKMALEKYLDLSKIYFDYGIISATSNSEYEKAKLLFREIRILYKVLLVYIVSDGVKADFFKDNELEKLKKRIRLLLEKGFLPKDNKELDKFIKDNSDPKKDSLEEIINIAEEYSLLSEPNIAAGIDLDVKNNRAFRFMNMRDIVDKYYNKKIISDHELLKNIVCYGLFDGGMGEAQSLACTKLPIIIANRVKHNSKDMKIYRNKKDVVGDILFNSFAGIDDNIKNQSDDGTSALCILIFGDALWIAHVGNIRALVCSENGKIVFETSDHIPSNPSEKKRIKFDGGSTSISGGLKIFPDEELDLDVSRALGYYCIGGDIPKGLIAIPDVKRIKLTADHRFIISATQDYFKIMSNDTIIGMVMGAIKDNVKAGYIEKSIHKKAVELGLHEDTAYPIVMIINWDKN